MVQQRRQLDILGLCGSLRAKSTNRAVLEAARLSAPPSVRRLSIADGAIVPHFNPDLDEPERIPQTAADWRELVQSSDGLVICMPEYAGGLPGAFKNSLDWLAGSMAIYRKPVAIFAASNRGSAGHAGLSPVLRTLGAEVVLPACISLGLGGAPVSADSLSADRTISTTIRAALDALVAHIHAQPRGCE